VDARRGALELDLSPPEGELPVLRRVEPLDRVGLEKTVTALETAQVELEDRA
jgi:hypothetical protein